MQHIIEQTLDKATSKDFRQGKSWYTKLNRYCRELGEIHSQPTWKVTAIMSALSPRTSFANNVHDTEMLLKYGKKAKLKSPLFRDKALKILKAKSYNEVKALFSEKTGRKTLSFWENLMLVGNRATIDTHMLQLFELEGSLTQKKYREMEQAIQNYADKVNMRAYDLQAVLWVVQRGEAF